MSTPPTERQGLQWKVQTVCWRSLSAGRHIFQLAVTRTVVMDTLTHLVPNCHYSARQN